MDMALAMNRSETYGQGLSVNRSETSKDKGRCAKKGCRFSKDTSWYLQPERQPLFYRIGDPDQISITLFS